MVKKPAEPSNTASPEIADEDIFAAMKEISGYLDITPGDFKEVYQLAWRHARERLLRTAQAREIMTRDVALVKVDTPLKEVAEVMARRGVSGVPVVDAADRVVGVISEKDFLKAMSSGGITSFMGVVAQCLQEKGCKALGIRQGQAADLMSAPAVTVAEETQVLEIIKLFKEKGINRVPVLDSQGRLTGIVSRGDLLELKLFSGGKPL